MKANEKKIWLFGVFSACPLKVALEGCPFEKYRKQSPLERWEYIEGLTEEEVDALILHHKKCLYKRESKGQTKCQPLKNFKETG